MADLHSLPGAAGAVPVHARAHLHPGVLCHRGHAEGDDWRPADRSCCAPSTACWRHLAACSHKGWLADLMADAFGRSATCRPMATSGTRTWCLVQLCWTAVSLSGLAWCALLCAALLDGMGTSVLSGQLFVSPRPALGPHMVPEHPNLPDCTPYSLHLMHLQEGLALCIPAGLLFQYPGLLLAGLVGVGAANWLKTPAPWLKALTSGGEASASAMPRATVPPPSSCCHYPVTILNKWLLHLHSGCCPGDACSHSDAELAHVCPPSTPLLPPLITRRAPVCCRAGPCGCGPGCQRSEGVDQVNLQGQSLCGHQCHSGCGRLLLPCNLGVPCEW